VNKLFLSESSDTLVRPSSLDNRFWLRETYFSRERLLRLGKEVSEQLGKYKDWRLYNVSNRSVIFAIGELSIWR
jgi:hypothetical protein